MSQVNRSRLVPGAATELARMRRRLTVLLSLLSIVIVAVFSLVVLRVDADLRDERTDAGLLRRLDQVAQVTAFEQGRLDRAGIEAVIGTDVGVVVRLPFEDLVEEYGLSLPWPGSAVLQTVAREVLGELDGEELDDTLASFGYVEGSVAERRDELVEDFPFELEDEAWRLWTVDQADAAGVDLWSEIDVVRDDALALDAAVLEKLWWRVEDGAGIGRVEQFLRAEALSPPEPGLAVRTRALRDGIETVGVAVVVADLDASEREARSFRLRVGVLAVALVGLGSSAAWVLAGRSIRPTARALAQQERFLAAAAHELRTPIAAIAATAQAPLDPDERAEQRLGRVAELAGSAAVLTDDLLTLARADADRLEVRAEPTRIDLLIEQVVDATADVSLELVPVVAEVDPRLFERVIRNLVTNARSHGHIDSASPLRVTLTEDTIEFVDAGPGIDQALRGDVFERFASAPSSKGHGLGLPLARWIARAHGGDLTLEESETGACFVVRLPARP